jgi:hypothetical protein
MRFRIMRPNAPHVLREKHPHDDDMRPGATCAHMRSGANYVLAVTAIGLVAGGGDRSVSAVARRPRRR